MLCIFEHNKKKSEYQSSPSFQEHCAEWCKSGWPCPSHLPQLPYFPWRTSGPEWGICRMFYFSLRNGIPVGARIPFPETTRGNAVNNYNLYQYALCPCRRATSPWQRHSVPTCAPVVGLLWCIRIMCSSTSPYAVPGTHGVEGPCASCGTYLVFISGGGRGGGNQIGA